MNVQKEEPKMTSELLLKLEMEKKMKLEKEKAQKEKKPAYSLPPPGV